MSVLDLFSLSGKVALVVGGSGRYGHHIARALLQAGAITYVTSRNKEFLSTIEIQFKQEGLEPCCEYMDQTNEESIRELRDRILKQHGSIDILVNNAVARPMSKWNDDTANFAESMKVNATGIYSLTKIIGNVMEEQHSGSIIQIGSIQGMVGSDESLYEGEDMEHGAPDYFFHKGGVINFTRLAASHYGKSNVRCNCISPGGVETSSTPAIFAERYRKRTLLNRMAKTTDLMGIIVFLASDASSYITGTNIPVDGGYTAI